MNAQNAQLAGALVGLGATITQAMDEIEDFVPCGHPATVVIDGLSSLNDRLTDDQRNDQVTTVTGLIDHVSEKRGVPAHPVIDVTELGSIKTQLLGELHDIACTVKPKTNTHQGVNAWIYRSLAAIESTGNLEAAARMAEVRSIKAAVETL
ncbi:MULTISPECIES: hypothetical protein [Collinsella]|uniref:Uncharacterized protein n=1 Tax=Collinsella ihumii TaxID=1720204 RepID=A0ABT7XCR8_9ACTN|nr:MULTISPECIES: hypothetical protein [Collinsella]MBM6689414.1 hypothetical protein [Collinsella tanakaei]MBM6776639.1 hypothetical protein [Collinsella tanakaei]MCF6412437.1 hypothetical protein [Collinsella tanakaei]MDN0063183.1 hypothetical protein [Collinsella ihumii]OUO60022.1 hypothetical protein B5F74_07385 [Collinsella sp. An271]